MLRGVQRGDPSAVARHGLVLGLLQALQLVGGGLQGLGGLLGGLLAGITPFKPGQALAMALIACASGSLGHLVMKAIKRDRGIPSWGSQGRSVTGASGLLDRVDALSFAAPVFFHSIRWTFGLH